MTNDELDRLADLIARTLLERQQPQTIVPRASWLPAPVRPEPPARGHEPPVWSGAAQSLGDVAPSANRAETPQFRVSTAELVQATRAAAEGKGKPGEDRAPRALDIQQVTFPQRMKALGYATGMFGKWHLGSEEGYQPTQRGFDTFFGILPFGLGGKGPNGETPPGCTSESRTSRWASGYGSGRHNTP